MNRWWRWRATGILALPWGFHPMCMGAYTPQAPNGWNLKMGDQLEKEIPVENPSIFQVPAVNLQGFFCLVLKVNMMTPLDDEHTCATWFNSWPFFIPDRWRSRFALDFGSRFLPSQKRPQQNCQVSNMLFSWVWDNQKNHLGFHEAPLKNIAVNGTYMFFFACY